MTPTKNHKYLGDGVYAEYSVHEIILRTGDHRDGYCDNKIYLDEEIWEGLIKFIEEVRK